MSVLSGTLGYINDLQVFEVWDCVKSGWLAIAGKSEASNFMHVWGLEN